jgi:ubiquinone/menaquinone biosynthesis C-methylase UbiE
MIDKVTGLMFALPQRSDEEELLDQDIQDREELAANFRDIRRVNQLLGGTLTVLRLLPRLLERIPADQTVTVLDLATGSGDIPVAISRWAKHRGVPIEIVASDYSDAILDLAREHIGDNPDITLACHDARSVPLPDGAFDIVLCSLSLHHFPPDEAVQVLKEMQRLASVGVILNDLRRSRLGYIAAWLAARVTTRNRLTRNDAPLSVLRAYTPEELRELLHQAGIDHAVISQHPWFRMAAVSRGARANA